MADPAPPLEAGRLLVATPALQDPNFESSVVLLLDVDDNGALGVVLNQASLVRVAEVLPGWADVVSPPDVLFAGGPVSTDSALAVGSLPSGGEAEDPVGFRRLYGDIGIIDLDAPPEVVAPALTGLRVFAGYAGWGSAQLEAEVESESWYVVPSLREDMFGADPEGLRRRVLRRQPGELAWVSTRPQDPTLN
jgi:putative transcriptional regulator